MTIGKKILVVYPHNPFGQCTGIDARYIQLLNYFKSKGFHISLLSLKNYDGVSAETQDFENHSLDNLFLYDFATGYRRSRQKKWLKPTYWLESLGLKRKKTLVPDYTFPGFKKYFQTINKQQEFDSILISYIHWAALAEIELQKKCSVILDLSDFTTLKLLERGGNRKDAAPLLAEEIRRIQLFDTVMCISSQEMWFFSHFAPGPSYHFVPHSLPTQKTPLPKKQKHHLLFIGSDNPFNQEAIKWFFQAIFPLFARPIKILVVGKITDYAPHIPGVTCIPYAPNLKEVYSKARIAICPMLGGTGIKIKIIEALSYGLPVVSTTRGMTGHPTKYKTGCLIADTANNFAAAITKLLQDQDFYSNQQQQAQEYFKHHFQEAEIYYRLDTIFLLPESP